MNSSNVFWRYVEGLCIWETYGNLDCSSIGMYVGGLSSTDRGSNAINFDLVDMASLIRVMRHKSTTVYLHDLDDGRLQLFETDDMM